MQITTVGLDLAKEVFHLSAQDANGLERKRRALRRNQVLNYFAQLPPCRVGMEACAGAHWWARQLQALGHQVKLVPPQYVKAYLRGQKNDYNDARAIAEAVRSPQMHFAAIKSAEQQDIQSLHRLRAGFSRQRTEWVNRLRGLLAEYGIVLPRSPERLRSALPTIIEDGHNELSPRMRRLLEQGYQHLCQLETELATLDRELKQINAEDERCQRLLSIPGFGPVVASAFLSTFADGSQFRRGRELAAALGLVPRQYSTGGRTALGSITKRGDRYLRSLLFQGARSVLNRAAQKTDPLSLWVNRIRAERGYNKACIALANKLARIGWAVLAHKQTYRPAAA